MAEEKKFKRKYPRFQAKHTVMVKKLILDSEDSFSKTEVMGLGGCMFLHHEKLGVGTGLELLISAKGKVIETFANIVYELESDEGIQIGVQFIRIPEQHRAILEELLGDASDVTPADD